MTTMNSAVTDFPAAPSSATPARGWFAHMIQLWLEHNARVLAMGGEPL